MAAWFGPSGSSAHVAMASRSGTKLLRRTRKMGMDMKKSKKNTIVVTTSDPMTIAII